MATKKKWVIADGSDRNYYLQEDCNEDCGYSWIDDIDDAVLTFDSEREARSWLERNAPVLTDIYEGNWKDAFFPVLMDDTEIVPETKGSIRSRITSQIRKVTGEGVQLGIGLRVAEVIQDHATRALQEAGVPEHVLAHPVIKAGILVAAPVGLNLVLPLVPKVKVPAVARGFIEAAATAAVAKVTNDFSKRALGFLRPMIKEIVDLTKLAKFK